MVLQLQLKLWLVDTGLLPPRRVLEPAGIASPSRFLSFLTTTEVTASLVRELCGDVPGFLEEPLLRAQSTGCPSSPSNNLQAINSLC